MRINKKFFRCPEMEIVTFEVSEIIVTSGFGTNWAGDEEVDWNQKLNS